MNIALLCRWKLEDGLTASTVIPQIQALISFPYISKVVVITLEDVIGTCGKSQASYPVMEHQKVKWFPLLASRKQSSIMNKIIDYRAGYKGLKQIVRNENIRLVIAHGAPAGALAYKVWQRTKVPFLVSSFEPHADYMLESKVWNQHGLKYKFQKHWEQLQKKHAAGLMPVAENYKKVLIEGGMAAEKIFVVPCSVDVCAFSFSLSSRERVRQQLAIPSEAITGIYVGKYGGLYYEQEAFAIYKQCFESIPNFRLLILSPQAEEAKRMLLQHHFDISKVYSASVPHYEVPDYLSAADFAFATIKSYPSARYCSPVKIGEYWASGLPVLLTEGVGDDSDIIQNEGGGALFNLKHEGSVERALQQIQQILQDPNHRQQIPKLAAKYRSPEKIKAAYAYFFNLMREQV